MEPQINLHHPSEKSPNSQDIRIGNYENIIAYGSSAGTKGFSESLVRKVIQKIPPGHQYNADYIHPSSTKNIFLEKSEDPNNFEALVLCKGGKWAKTMMRNKETNMIIFRTATFDNKHEAARNYKESIVENWIVGKKIFVACRGFWLQVRNYFEEIEDH